MSYTFNVGVLFRGMPRLRTYGGNVHRFSFFFLNDPAPPEIYPLPLPAPLPICGAPRCAAPPGPAGRPAADRETEHEHGRDPEPPAEPRAQHDGALPPGRARGRDPLPHLLARRRGRAVIVLHRVLQQAIEPVFRHDTHSPAKSASASRSLARARDSCAFDVPVSMSRAFPISSCVYPST